MAGLQKSGLSYDFISSLYIVECWFFYADYINNLQLERYLQNVPTDKKGKVIPYDRDIFTRIQ